MGKNLRNGELGASQGKTRSLSGMAMQRDDLMQRIRLGEDSTLEPSPGLRPPSPRGRRVVFDYSDRPLELKRVLLAGSRVTAPRRDEMADELAAMANGWGGTIVLGVDDKTRGVLGIPVDQLDVVELWAREICKDSVTPPLDASVQKLELPDAGGGLVPVICIRLVRSVFVHKSPGGYFRRVGSSKRELSPESLARLFQERSQSRVIRFDESPLPQTTPEDLDDGLTRRFLRDEFLEKGATENAARKLRLVADDDDGEARLTLAGVLLCTREPQNRLPYAYVQAVSYAGDRADVNYQTDARDIGGTLDEQATEGLHFVRGTC